MQVPAGTMTNAPEAAMKADVVITLADDPGYYGRQAPTSPGPAATKVLRPYALTAGGSRKSPENRAAKSVSTFGTTTLVSASPAHQPGPYL